MHSEIKVMDESYTEDNCNRGCFLFLFGLVLFVVSLFVCSFLLIYKTTTCLQLNETTQFLKNIYTIHYNAH